MMRSLFLMCFSFQFLSIQANSTELFPKTAQDWNWSQSNNLHRRVLQEECRLQIINRKIPISCLQMQEHKIWNCSGFDWSQESLKTLLKWQKMSRWSPRCHQAIGEWIARLRYQLEGIEETGPDFE